MIWEGGERGIERDRKEERGSHVLYLAQKTGKAGCGAVTDFLLVRKCALGVKERAREREMERERVMERFGLSDLFLKSPFVTAPPIK